MSGPLVGRVSSHARSDEAPGSVTTAATFVGFDGGSPGTVDRAIAVETPVQVNFGNMPFAVMMMTPSDLVDFAYGFSLTEGVIEEAAQIRSVEISEEASGSRLAIDLVGSRLQAHLARQRSLTGRTGCGLCGIDDLAALPRARKLEGPDVRLEPAAVRRALNELDSAQRLNRETHAVHAAAFAEPSGNILLLREDVGRHNALDKLIGALLRAGVAPEEGFIVITSRASYEMVEKVCAFGTHTLVAISAPTSLALERARALDLTLVGVARHDGMTIFHGAERLCAQEMSR